MATTGALLWLKNDKAANRDPLDIPGLLLVTSGLFCLVYGFSHAETTAWSNPFTVGFLVVGVILLASFALLEPRLSYPLLPPRIVRNRTRGGSILAMLLASMGLFGVFLFLTYYMQETLRFSPVKTGIAFLPMIAALAGMAQVSNRVLLPRFGPKVIVPIGLLMNAAALYLLHLVGLHSSYVSHVLPYLLLLGFGFGLSLAPSFSTGTLGLKPHDAGVGSATLNTSQQVGGSIGTALLNTLAASAATAYLVGRAITPANLQAAAVHSYTTAFLYSSLIFVVAAVIAGLVLPRGNMRALSRPAPDRTGGTGTDSRPSAGVISGGTTQPPVGLRASPALHS
jgi:sugar phosphate permease